MAYYRHGAGEHEKAAIDATHRFIDRFDGDIDQLSQCLHDLAREQSETARDIMRKHGFYPQGNPGTLIYPSDLDRLIHDTPLCCGLLATLYDYENAQLAVQAFIHDPKLKDYWKSTYFTKHFKDDGTVANHRKSSVVINKLVQRRKALELPAGEDLYKDCLSHKIG